MDQLTQQVKKQYEAYPYPHIPLGALEDYVPLTCHYQFVHYYLTHTLPSTQTIKILDAGCGTGFSTYKLAQHNPQATILAIELSSQSLEIAQKRLAQAGLSQRVSFQQADLIEFQTDQKFDYINCSGVLHHLSQPERGLKNLAQGLKPQGIMSLLLYSSHARHLIKQTQNILKQLFTEETTLAEQLQICRQFFNDLPNGHPIKADYLSHFRSTQKNVGEEMANSDAFLVDTYLNVCEYTYTLAEVFQFLETANLSLLRFVDEQQWQPQVLLPSLKSRLAQLTHQQQYLLMDQLKLKDNYVFWCGFKETLPPKITPILQPQTILLPSPLATLSGTHLNSQLGISLDLNKYALKAWALIDGKTELQTIQKEWAKELAVNEQVVQENLMPFVKQLIEYYLVLVP